MLFFLKGIFKSKSICYLFVVESPYGVDTGNQAKVMLGFGGEANFYLEQQCSPLEANSTKGNVGVTWSP